jgi:hypothetical protein
MTSKTTRFTRITVDEEGNKDAAPAYSRGQTGTRPTLSATALSNYEVCGRRGQWYHDVDIPRGPATPNMIRGSV